MKPEPIAMRARALLFRRFTEETYTEPVSLKYDKLVAKYPCTYWVRTFLQCMFLLISSRLEISCCIYSFDGHFHCSYFDQSLQNRIPVQYRLL